MTCPTTGAPRSTRYKPNFWVRSTRWQKAGVVAATLVLPCCGGGALLFAVSGGNRPVVATAPAALPPAPAAERLAGGRPAPSSSATTRPAVHPPVTKRKITKRRTVPFATRTVRDGSLDKGQKRVRVEGVPGVRTTTYEIVLAGGSEVSRRVVRSVVTRRPVAKVVAVGTRTAPADDGCDPNYTPCVPVASDVDCAGGGGDGPAYADGPIQVIGDDRYGLDRDGDHIACDAA